MKDSLTDVSWARRVGQDTGGRPADGPPKAGLAVSGSLTSIALAPADPGPAPRVAWKRCRGRRRAVGPVSRSAGQPVSRSVEDVRLAGPVELAVGGHDRGSALGGACRGRAGHRLRRVLGAAAPGGLGE